MRFRRRDARRVYHLGTEHTLSGATSAGERRSDVGMVEGHSGDEGNDAADKRANWAQNEQDIDLSQERFRSTVSMVMLKRM